MKASTKRILTITASCLLIIGAVVVYTSFIKPEFGRIQEKRAEVYSKRQIFKDQSEAVGRVQELVARLKGASELQTTVEKVLPAGSDVTGILSQVQAMADRAGVAVSNFSVQQTPFEAANEEGEDSLRRRLGVLSVNVSTAGSYEGIKNFFRFLQTNVRVFNIQGFQISAQAGKGGEGIDAFSATFAMKAYYQED